jgi:hypothetical protein
LISVLGVVLGSGAPFAGAPKIRSFFGGPQRASKESSARSRTRADLCARVLNNKQHIPQTPKTKVLMSTVNRILCSASACIALTFFLPGCAEIEGEEADVGASLGKADSLLSCDMLLSEKPCELAGCDWLTRSPTYTGPDVCIPSTCEVQNTQDSCEAMGCDWLTRTPTYTGPDACVESACEFQSSEKSCELAGCDWLTRTPTYTGPDTCVPTSCSAQDSEKSCELAGCNWITRSPTYTGPDTCADY